MSKWFSFSRKCMQSLSQRSWGKASVMTAACASAVFSTVGDHNPAVCSTNDTGFLKFERNASNELLKERIDCNSKETLDTDEDLDRHLEALSVEWDIFRDYKNDNKFHLVRVFDVETFEEVADITKAIIEVANDANYHPDIQIRGHRQVIVDIYSYRLRHLRRNDFIFAARIDASIEKVKALY